MNRTWILYIFLQITFFLSSCGTRNVNSGESQDNASSRLEKRGSSDMQIGEEVKIEEMVTEGCPYHTIKFDSLLILTRNFVLDSELNDLARNISLGGLFNVQSLKGLMNKESDTTMQGFAGWWCWNDKAPNGLPKLFIALEHHSTYSDFNIPNFPTSAEVVISRNSFTYGGDSANFRDWLWDHSTTPILLDQLLTTDRIRDFARYFKFKFPYSYQAQRRFNEYSVAFFRNDSICETLSEFLSQFKNYEFPYVRYYFGLDTINPTNKLRLILVPVDANGKNIHIFNDQEAYYLQHTFP